MKKVERGIDTVFAFSVVVLAALFFVVIGTEGVSFAARHQQAAVGASSTETPVGKVENILTALAEGNGYTQYFHVGQPFGKISGLLMFRGNPTRTWYGTGPLPDTFSILWKYPKEPMCSTSVAWDKEGMWCGSGWTGQPVVWDRPDGITEVIFGAFDKNVHFLNATTGQETRPSFHTGDIIKGSVTMDPDGFPLLYFGSRDNKLRIVALDQAVPTELWALDADTLPSVWNDDWDGNPVVINDIMFEGGENGWFYAIKLNRQYDAAGKVTIAPKIIFQMPTYDASWIAKVDRELSIENSVAFYKDRAYFANSGGRVIGLDISNIENGIAPVVFDFWTGDDTDATIVVDDEGMLYVASEIQRFTERSKELGQLMKLNPYSTDPYIWGVAAEVSSIDNLGGIWATPALYKNVVYVTTHKGDLLAVNKKSGEVTFRRKVGYHSWSSPLIIDDELLVGTCAGKLEKYSLANPAQPVLLTSFPIPSTGCIESTPAVWKGQVFFGNRDGYFYSLGAKILE